MCAYTAYVHILYVVHQEYGVIEVLIAVYRGEALVLVAPLLVVPTELRAINYTSIIRLKH